MHSVLTYTKFDKKLIHHILEYKKFIYMVLITLIALGIRYCFIHYESGDYTIYLQKWCTFIESNGGFSAIKLINSDYNVSYLYILALFTYLPFSYNTKIKALSIVFDFICAVAVFLIVKYLCHDSSKSIKPYLAYGFALLLPTVIINGSLWGQCDIIYTSFILLSLYMLMKEKFPAAFILYGIAFAFKLQAIFIFPLYIFY